MSVMRFWGIACLFLLFGACTDALDVVPENSVTFENFFQTEKDLETSLNSLKYRFREQCAFNANKPPMCKGIVADKFDPNYGIGWMIKLWKDLDLSLTHTPGNVNCDWKGYYLVITEAQVLLENIDRAQLPEERLNFYKGQAHFYQSYVYFLIAQIWGDVPLIKASRDVGPKGRAPWQVVVQFAMDEADEAIRLLPACADLKDFNGVPMTQRYTPSREVAYSLKAFICAWKAALNNEPALFEDAVTAANEVIASPSFSLAVTPEEVCASVLVGDSKNESIFEVPIRDYWGEISISKAAFVGGFALLTYPVKPEDGAGDIEWAEARIYYTTVDRMYPVVAGVGTDSRRDAYFYQLDQRKDSASAKGFAYPYKFRVARVGNSGDEAGQFINLNQNRVIYRLADILLLRAECLARLNRKSLAILDLKKVRERAYGKATPYPMPGVDSGDLQYNIFKERERELIWESSRYFDVVRNGYWKTEISTAYSRLTEQNVKDGALYLPVGAGAQRQNPMVMQNKYWLSRW